MRLVLQRGEHDCCVAALAMAIGVDYEVIAGEFSGPALSPQLAQRVFIAFESVNVYRNNRLFADHERDGHTHFSVGYALPF